MTTNLLSVIEQQNKALEDYMHAVETMNAAMKDGLNVHGAISGLIGAEDNAAAAIAAGKQALEQPQGELMVDMTPPATARDRWMYQQGRLAERDSRTHPQATEPAPKTGYNT